jgi:hypothetical protein
MKDSKKKIKAEEARDDEEDPDALLKMLNDM